MLHAHQAGLPQRLLDAQLQQHLPDFFVPLPHTVYHLQLLLVQDLEFGVESIPDGIDKILDSDRGGKTIFSLLDLTFLGGMHLFV